MTGQTHVTNSQAVVHERDLATAIPIISGNGLPFLAQNNFQTPLLFGLPCLLIFSVSVRPSPHSPHFIKTPSPIIWNWRVLSEH